MNYLGEPGRLIIETTHLLVAPTLPGGGDGQALCIESVGSGQVLPAR